MDPVASVWVMGATGKGITPKKKKKQTSGISSVLPATPRDAGGKGVAAFWRSWDAIWQVKGMHKFVFCSP